MAGSRATLLTFLVATLGAATPVWGQPADTTYFVVALRTPPPVPPGDSYILPLADSLHIATARALLSGDSGPYIAVAEIAAGADGINRDYFAAKTRLWSWHVVGFRGFSSLTIELCDGSPTLVEADVEGWIDNTDGVICFWDYTVVREIRNPTPTAVTTWGRIKTIYR